MKNQNQGDPKITIAKISEEISGGHNTNYPHPPATSPGPVYKP